jgi:hypothetical protein
MVNKLSDYQTTFETKFNVDAASAKSLLKLANATNGHVYIKGDQLQVLTKAEAAKIKGIVEVPFKMLTDVIKDQNRELEDKKAALETIQKKLKNTQTFLLNGQKTLFSNLSTPEKITFLNNMADDADRNKLSNASASLRKTANDLSKNPKMSKLSMDSSLKKLESEIPKINKFVVLNNSTINSPIFKLSSKTNKVAEKEFIKTMDKINKVENKSQFTQQLKQIDLTLKNYNSILYKLDSLIVRGPNEVNNLERRESAINQLKKNLNLQVEISKNPEKGGMKFQKVKENWNKEFDALNEYLNDLCEDKGNFSKNELRELKELKNKIKESIDIGKTSAEIDDKTLNNFVKLLSSEGKMQ